MYEIMGVVVFLLPKSLMDVASLCSYTLVFAVFAVVQLIDSDSVQIVLILCCLTFKYDIQCIVLICRVLLLRYSYICDAINLLNRF